MSSDPFAALASLATSGGERNYYKLDAAGDVAKLPFSIRVLLEAALRNCDGFVVTEDHVKAIANYDATNVGEVEIPFSPGRVILQDFTGVPAVVDLAAMRAAMQRLGGDPRKVNPLVPCDLVIDHSVQVDAFGSDVALRINSEKEFDRNIERYNFLKWGQKAFDNFRVVPPATGIVHQVNLEYLAKVTWEKDGLLYPDSLVGTDSHTTMINGLGVVGWGVGGIEAEAVMLGQPIYMLLPEVVGFKLTGELPEGTTATDLVLRVTEMLRQHGVVSKFVEFFGPGMDTMPLANRATIANMAPEYGATMGFFPVDGQTINYMRLTGRDEALLDTVETYCKANHLWRDEIASEQIVYSSTLELDMSTIEPALAGPKRPQDRIALTNMKSQWQQDLSVTFGKSGHSNDSNHETMTHEGGNAAAISPAATAVLEADPGVEGVDVHYDGQTFKLNHGDVVIAAITSCTNTSNPEVLIAAGLVAKKANELGLTRKPWVKTSLAPGSKVVTEYYEKAGLTEHLDALGFNLVGYGCTTCIGNSGPLPPEISDAVNECDLVVASVLSGNRNFEGRVNKDVKANYLASPPLCVAYAIAGNVNVDLTTEPLGQDASGNDVYLKDIWPTQKEIQDVISVSVTREDFIEQYASVFDGSEEWQAIEGGEGMLFEWDESSTYIQEPPFFIDLPEQAKPIESIADARCLLKLGDSVTTDHISPAGNIKTDSPAGEYLQSKGVAVSMFNSYGARRGNDRVMVRGTFANIRVRNQLAPGTEGGVTMNFKTKQVEPVFDAAVDYGSAATSDADMNPAKDAPPLVVLTGKDYGMGSSRDWAAKGAFLLGVRAVIAESYERIHRSNLVGMGVLPLQFKAGETAESLGLDGTEHFNIDIDDSIQPGQDVMVVAVRKADPDSGNDADGDKVTIQFTAKCRIDTPVEVDYYRNGGILHTVLRKFISSS